MISASVAPLGRFIIVRTSAFFDWHDFSVGFGGLAPFFI
jgi:hypothetical protein